MAVDPQSASAFFYVLQDSIRILFVDDDPILREFAAVNLASEQASVETAGDGREALAAIRAAAPDLVLLDLEMPNLDGFGVLEALRGDPRWRDLPVIVVTGREDIEAVDRAFAAGATSFVVKPLNWRLLCHQVRYVHRTALGERRAAAALKKLAGEGVRFIGRTLGQFPQLKPAAVAFAKAADDALGQPDDARAA